MSKFLNLRSISAALISFITLTFFSVSCTDDIHTISEESNNKICFAVERIDNASFAFVRSEDKSGGVSLDVNRLQDVSKRKNTKGLYLHTITKDEINPDKTEQESLRASQVTTDKMYDSFALFGFLFPKNETWNETRLPNYIYNQEVTKESGWDSKKYWPGGGNKIKFFAYAPIHCPGLEITNDTHPGKPELTYTVPKEIDQQKDLLIAETNEYNGDYEQNVPLKFKHALTAIRFALANDIPNGKIKRITINNVFNKGSIKCGDNQAWSKEGTKDSFRYDLNFETQPNSIITDDDKYFMMIPQILPKNAELSILIEEEPGSERELKVSIGGAEWPMGKTVTYRISKSDVAVESVFEVKKGRTIIKGPYSFEYKSVKQKPLKLNVTSYLIVKKGEEEERKIPCPWSVRPDRSDLTFTSEPTSGNGGEKPELLSLNVTEPKAEMESEHLTELQNERISSSVIDLSMVSGKKTTANCYKIHGPGKYKIPLVYGNGYLDGQPNVWAYKLKEGSGLKVDRAYGRLPFGDEYKALKTFVDYKGKEITSSDISYVPDKADLIWQDAESLVSDVKLSEDKKFLEFEVKKETIQSGNAVVAIMDNTNNKEPLAIWSWHIWISPKSLDQDVTVYSRGANFKTYKDRKKYKNSMFKIPIGYCEPIKYTYPKLELPIKISQDIPSQYAGRIKNKTELKITLIRKEHSKSISDRVVYYMFGRKDPFPGQAYVTETKIIEEILADNPYKIASKLRLVEGIDKKYNELIAHPWLGCKDVSYNHISFPYNYWNNYDVYSNRLYENNTIIKTIYDPSPVGYNIPPDHLFTNISPKDEVYMYFTFEVSKSDGGNWINIDDYEHRRTNHDCSYYSFYSEGSKDGKWVGKEIPIYKMMFRKSDLGILSTPARGMAFYWMTMANIYVVQDSFKEPASQPNAYVFSLDLTGKTLGREANYAFGSVYYPAVCVKTLPLPK